MSFRALIYTHEESVAGDLVESVARLPIEWFIAASPEQASALVAQGTFDVMLIDCDSVMGRELFAQAQNLRFARMFALFGVCTDPTAVPDSVTVQKPINQEALSNQLRYALPLFS
jgi:hypothetical protein